MGGRGRIRAVCAAVQVTGVCSGAVMLFRDIGGTVLFRNELFKRHTCFHGEQDGRRSKYVVRRGWVKGHCKRCVKGRCSWKGGKDSGRWNMLKFSEGFWTMHLLKDRRGWEEKNQKMHLKIQKRGRKKKRSLEIKQTNDKRRTDPLNSLFTFTISFWQLPQLLTTHCPPLAEIKTAPLFLCCAPIPATLLIYLSRQMHIHTVRDRKSSNHTSSHEQ